MLISGLPRRAEMTMRVIVEAMCISDSMIHVEAVEDSSVREALCLFLLLTLFNLSKLHDPMWPATG